MSIYRYSISVRLAKDGADMKCRKRLAVFLKCKHDGAHFEPHSLLVCNISRVVRISRFCGEGIK